MLLTSAHHYSIVQCSHNSQTEFSSTLSTLRSFECISNANVLFLFQLYEFTSVPQRSTLCPNFLAINWPIEVKYLSRFVEYSLISAQLDIIMFKMFLALLCATAQQSYCRHAGVRRPSVRPSSVRP